MDRKQNIKFYKEYEDSIYVTKLLLNLSGFWPSSDNKFGFLRISCIIGQTFTSLYITADDIYHSFPDVVLISKYACFHLAVILGAVKMFNYLHYRYHIIELIKEIREDFWSITDDNDMRIYKPYAHVGKIMAMANSFMVFLTGILCISLPIISMAQIKSQIKQSSNTTVPNLLPFEVYFPGIDPYKTPVYEIFYFFEIASVILSLFVIAAFDNIFAVFVIQLSGQFKVLQYNIENIGKNLTDDVDEIVNDYTKSSSSISDQSRNQQEEVLYKDLTVCVQKHQRLIRFSTDVEDIFTITIMFQFVISSFFICLCGFQITTLEGDVAAMPVFVCYIITALIQLYMYCYVGNELMTTSSDVAISSYLCSWYSGSLRFKTTIQQIIMRAQTPQVLTANKFSDVTLASFTAILSTAGSYFTLLTTINEDQ